MAKLALDAELKLLLKQRFPEAAFACGYGSGIFKQHNRSIGNMVDIIIAVENSREWHYQNLHRNPKDYAFLPRYLLNSNQISCIQQKFGGRMWFNPLVSINNNGHDLILKYGVVSLQDMLRDLQDWETFYLAGRLQKPILVLQENYQVTQNNMRNRNQALAMAILMLLKKKEEFTFEEILQTIVGLSYQGDIRVGIAESPTKVQDIVLGSFQQLKEIYSQTEGTGKFLTQVNGSFRLNVSLPDIYSVLPRQYQGPDGENRLRRTIRTVSFQQTFKGLLTAGFAKSAQYALSKVAKRFV